MENVSGIVSNRFFHDLLLSRKYKVTRHAVSLMVIILVTYNSLSLFAQPYDLYVKLLMYAILILLYYFNMYWLVPKFLLQSKFLPYCLFIFGYIVLAYVPALTFHQKFGAYLLMTGKNRLPVPGFLGFTFNLFIMAAASTAIKLIQRWILDTEKIHSLEKITIRSELELLKNQINPHFLFNMLNNANVLTQTDPERASQVLMKLSDILRYQLYDSARQQVLLTAEITFLNDYLNLERTRRDNFEFWISAEGDLSGVQVPPMLFITFIQNSVKHSIDPSYGSYVRVYFQVYGDYLIFDCINSKPLRKTRRDNTGLGLVNAKRRLDLLYPDRHVIETTDATESYSVTLNLCLQSAEKTRFADLRHH
ncbi:MAG TPA: histidine kinase [Puia sp.]|nr:histidine kinase [Puia sp.]